MPRLSGLQRDVLSLYRQCLRAARNKTEFRSVRTVQDSSPRRNSAANFIDADRSSANMLPLTRKTLVLSNTCYGKATGNSRSTNHQESVISDYDSPSHYIRS
ncbi:hypothetical protein M8818_005177 [Zalaria obscura]|uniref:Uncharacterized protein n=1 Tax=Zalaria obscura TaxID=2024903 RepID=A0ACC3SA77_9PEZI